MSIRPTAASARGVADLTVPRLIPMAVAISVLRQVEVVAQDEGLALAFRQSPQRDRDRPLLLGQQRACLGRLGLAGALR